MQLVAYGAQDVYLTGNPQITFFKVVYRRHTNFSMEAIEQTINGSQKDGSGSVTISRNGDLVHKVYVVAKDAGVALTNGSEMVSLAELEIGGQLIDRHRSEWMQIWNELSTPESKAIGLKAMQRDIGSHTTGAKTVMVPLQFWFCRNPGLALPLIALQYHEVKIKCTWGIGTDKGDAIPKSVFCDYIYLDTDERRRFAQVSHEYLIEQVQYASIGTADTTVKLNFNHPVKELIWTSTTDYVNAKLVLNGHDRFSAQDKEYFQLRQPIDYHTAVPGQNLPSAAYAAARGGSTSYTLISNVAGNAAEAGNGATAVATASTMEVALGNDDDLDAGSAYANHADDATSNPARDTFIFLTTGGLSSPLAVGDVVVVTVSGTESIGSSVLAKVTHVKVGAEAGVHPNNTAVRFDIGLIGTVAGGDGVATADGFTIQSIVKVADAGCRTSQMTKKINCYSFALKPEEHQPSGTCNFSRIDTAQLILNTALGNGHWVYAVNYNVLRIMSGMGGLAYSN
jgi:hypothetical protein